MSRGVKTKACIHNTIPLHRIRARNLDTREGGFSYPLIIIYKCCLTFLFRNLFIIEFVIIV